MVIGNDNADFKFRNSISADLEPERGAFLKILGDGKSELTNLDVLDVVRPQYL